MRTGRHRIHRHSLPGPARHGRVFSMCTDPHARTHQVGDDADQCGSGGGEYLRARELNHQILGSLLRLSDAVWDSGRIALQNTGIPSKNKINGRFVQRFSPIDLMQIYGFSQTLLHFLVPLNDNSRAAWVGSSLLEQVFELSRRRAPILFRRVHLGAKFRRCMPWPARVIQYPPG